MESGSKANKEMKIPVIEPLSPLSPFKFELALTNAAS